MKINRGLLAGLVAGVSVLAVSSCAYDPYYSGVSYSGSYGHGYGYGNSGFSTSVFVSTGNPRWGYDPYAGCYYDYTRRSYYDPYLYGYYPFGYRPRYVYGAPHPGGWSRGRTYCPPPTRIRSHTLNNYDNRAESYRSLGRDWSRNVSFSAPTDNRREGYGGRETRQQGYNDSRGSTFPQRQENFPSRGGSFQRDGDDRGRVSFDRGYFRSRGFDSGSNRVTPPQPSFPTSRGDERREGSEGRFQGQPEAPQLDRQPPPRMERPEPPQRRERPIPPPEAAPGGGAPSPNPFPRGRGRGGIQSLGEG
jgi:hypothetical protein